MFDLENSIQQWLKHFRKHQAFDEGAQQEMEQHMRDHVEDLVSQGHSEEEAFNIASQMFGEVAPVSKEERSVQLRPLSVQNFISRAILRNYYKTSLRSLSRNPLSSLVNILGLSAAIGICVLGYAFNRYVANIDQFHLNKDEVFLTTFWANRDGELQQYGQAPAPIGGLIAELQTPGIEACRIQNRNVVVKRKALVFNERVRLVDPNFLEFFTFPMKWSESDPLGDPTSIVLSEGMARKYFGDQNPIGQDLQIIFDVDLKRTFSVSAVAKRFPAASSFQFDFLLNLDVLDFIDPDIRTSDWRERLTATFVRVDPSENLDFVNLKLESFQTIHNEIDDQWQIESFELEPLATLYRNTDDIRGDISGRGFGEMYYSTISFLIIGIMVLVLAATNYINIAIVSAVKRLKEIGLRKVIGASRGAVLIQFLAENLILMSLATLIGFVLGGRVFVPWLERTMSFQMDFDWFDPQLLVFLPSVLLFTALISGVYPAIHVSGIQVASLFRGGKKIGQKRLLTKIFVGFQLFISCLLISMAVLFTQNASYQQGRSWGYEEKGVVYVQVPDQSSYEQLENVMDQNPAVVTTAGARDHLGRSSSIREIQYLGAPYEVHDLAVSPGYFSTMQISFLEGRGFQDHFESDKKSIVINETMADRLEIEYPIGKWVKLDSITYHIVGLVQDFHAYSFYVKVPPTMFTLSQKKDHRFLAIRSEPQHQKRVYEALEEQWAALFPEIPFSGGYQEDVWGNFHQSMNDGSNFWKALASIVTLISGLGLYGLLALNVAGRTREFSIRKVLGARLENIARILSAQYWLIFLLTVGLAAPASYYMIQMIFGLFYVYHMPLTYGFMIYSGSVLLLVMILIIGIELRRLLVSNPVDGLKVE